MNPFTGLVDPTCALLAGIHHGHARAYMMAARSANTFGHKNTATDYVSMARRRHHDYLRALRKARETL